MLKILELGGDVERGQIDFTGRARFERTNVLITRYYLQRLENEHELKTQYPSRYNVINSLLSPITLSSTIDDIYRRAKSLGFTTPEQKGRAFSNVFLHNPVREVIVVENTLSLSGNDPRSVKIIRSPFTSTSPPTPNGRDNNYPDDYAVWYLDLASILAKFKLYLSHIVEHDLSKNIRQFIYTEIVLPLMRDMVDRSVIKIISNNIQNKGSITVNNPDSRSYLRNYDLPIEYFADYQGARLFKKTGTIELTDLLEYLSPYEASYNTIMGVPTLPLVSNTRWIAVLSSIDTVELLLYLSKSINIVGLKRLMSSYKRRLKILHRSSMYESIPDEFMYADLKSRVARILGN